MIVPMAEVVGFLPEGVGPMGYGDMGHAATQEALIANTQGSRDSARPI